MSPRVDNAVTGNRSRAGGSPLRIAVDSRVDPATDAVGWAGVAGDQAAVLADRAVVSARRQAYWPIRETSQIRGQPAWSGREVGASGLAGECLEGNARGVEARQVELLTSVIDVDSDQRAAVVKVENQQAATEA